jgi:uncharacterized protein (DUF1501 family)
MKRRQFLRRASAAALTLPLIIGGLPFHAHAHNTKSALLQALLQSNTETDRVLVLVQLTGGNDGLNTFIPLDQYSALASLRSNVLIPDNKVLKINGITNSGFHPSMPEFQSLFNGELLRVVQMVGYPQQNYSHFRSTDIWLTGSDYNETLLSGWLGRYLSDQFPGYPDGYPNASMPDPLALTIGSTTSTAFMGTEAQTAISISDPAKFYQLVDNTVDPAPNTPAGHELTYIRLVAQQTEKYTDVIKAAAEKATNRSTKYPTGNTLSDQLKIVARLIAGGLKTRVYLVSIGGFDTHSNQVDSSNTTAGTHATLLQKVSQAINAFQDDLQLLGIADRVVGMTFSEFGRRIVSNASLGTDHGAAAPLFVFGTQVLPGVLGNNPTINPGATVNDNLPHQYDFRQIYATVLKDWFGVSDETLTAVMLKEYSTVPIFKSTASSRQNLRTNAQVAEEMAFRTWPNPFWQTAGIEFNLHTAGQVQIEILQSDGRKVSTILNTALPAGKHEVFFDADLLPAGIYLAQLVTPSGVYMRRMTLVR